MLRSLVQPLVRSVLAAAQSGPSCPAAVRAPQEAAAVFERASRVRTLCQKSPFDAHRECILRDPKQGSCPDVRTCERQQKCEARSDREIFDTFVLCSALEEASDLAIARRPALPNAAARTPREDFEDDGGWRSESVSGDLAFSDADD